MNRRTRERFLFGVWLCVAVSGCVVSESKYDAVVAENLRQREQMAQDAAEKQRLQRQLSANQQQLELSQREIAAKQSQLEGSQRQIADAQAQIQRLAGAIRYTYSSDTLFTPGSWELSARGQQVIAQLAAQHAVDQRLKLVINGFTDSTPLTAELRRRNIASNTELSQKRAETVMQFMIAQGVKPELVSAQGFGEDGAIAPNESPQGRAQNRRIEITVAGS